MINPLEIGDLKLKIPVIQGGMGVGISLSKLAGSVAREGGMGVISTAQIGFREPDFLKNPLEANFCALKKEIAKAKEIGKGGVIGANIMVATRHYKEYVKNAVLAGVDVILSGAGLPVDLPEYVKGSKVKIAPIISSLKAFTVISRVWERKYARYPDFVVVEGPKAGGHLGFSKEAVQQLTQEEYDKVIVSIVEKAKEYSQKAGRKIPVIAAGGIFDRQDMEHALSLGADGVQVGTRFVTTKECDADTRYKESYLKARKEDIVLVDSPVGMPGRAISNAFLERVKTKPEKITHCYQCIEGCKGKDIPYCITEALVHAALGDTEHALLFCGENAWKCSKIEEVREIMKEFSGNNT